jgi:hypothetical protein
MSATARLEARRSGAALLAAGLLLSTISVAWWHATPAESEELFSYQLRATARGYKMSYDDPTGMEVMEGNVPETRAQLDTGPVGLGLASLAWPGPLAANMGTLIVGLNPDAPPEFQQLDYPVRAEARTGQDPPTTTYDNVPGTSLSATATDKNVEALASVQNASGDDESFGPTDARSAVALSEEGGTAESASVVQRISLAGGVIAIESVQSSASATTDGTAADGTSSTTVNGLTIAGQPARVDENGVTIGDANQPLNAVANQLAEQAFAEAGIEMIVSAPAKEVEGASARVRAGSLIILWDWEGGKKGVAIGGAEASVTGAPGFDSDLDVDLDGDFGGDFGAGDFGGDGGSFDIGGEGSFGDAGSFDTDQLPLADDSGLGPTSEQELVLGGTPAVSIGGTPVGLGQVALGFTAAGLLAVGMRRLSRSVLTESAGSTCPLAGEA